jgi:hypothetical protein
MLTKIIAPKTDCKTAVLQSTTPTYTIGELKKKYWFEHIWNYSKWIAFFWRQDWNNWWIKDTGEILAEWFYACRTFQNWYASFIRSASDRKMWLIDENWKVLFEWLFYYRLNVSSTGNFTFEITEGGEKISNVKSWNKGVWIFCNLVKKGKIEYWWIWSNWIILAEWFDHCGVFNRDIAGFAKFEKDWRQWYIKIDQGSSKKGASINTDFIFYEVIKEWKTYLERNWKFYIKELM